MCTTFSDVVSRPLPFTCVLRSLYTTTTECLLHVYYVLCIPQPPNAFYVCTTSSVYYYYQMPFTCALRPLMLYLDRCLNGSILLEYLLPMLLTQGKFCTYVLTWLYKIFEPYCHHFGLWQ